MNICKYKKTIHSTFLIVCFWLCCIFCFVELVLFFSPPSSLLHIKRIPSKNHPKCHIVERAWNDSWVRYLDYRSQRMKVNMVMLWDVSEDNYLYTFLNFLLYLKKKIPTQIATPFPTPIHSTLLPTPSPSNPKKG